MYLKMRAAKKIDDKPSSELMLFLLNAAGLHEEVIDFCLHINQASQIKEYYLSEALLHVAPQKVIPDSTENLSACTVTQGTKALFLQNKPEHALKFFKDNSANINKQCEAREKALVDFYDQIFNTKSSNNEDVSLKEFKTLYKRTQLKASRVAKEVFAVN